MTGHARPPSTPQPPPTPNVGLRAAVKPPLTFCHGGSPIPVLWRSPPHTLPGLTIENFSELPDGGPLSYDGRAFDLGRDTDLDWTLPDPSMFISGKHCEVRAWDGANWLHDVNAIFLIVPRAGSRNRTACVTATASSSADTFACVLQHLTA